MMVDVQRSPYLETELNGEKRQFPLRPGQVCHIGRSDRNDIVVDDEVASRNHAMLQADADRFLLMDRNSSNGTFVNGVRICVPVVLRPGDHITIGSYEFTFYDPAASVTPLEPDPEELAATDVIFAEKLITVLVVDIRDFTGLARRTDPGTLAQITRSFFGEAGLLLLERGSSTQKYIGDAVMAYWQHSAHQPELTELIAVLESAAHIHDIADRLQDRFHLDAPVRLGAGINTGLASVGNVGSVAFADYTAMGDVVNKTFRLESATKETGCDLHLGEETWRYLSAFTGSPPVFEPQTLNLKGYEEPITVWGASMASLRTVLEILHKHDGTVSG